MHIFKKKTLIYLLWIIFIIGCGKKTSEDKISSLIIWHWMTDRHEVFKDLAKQYETETGKKVNFQLNAPSELFTAKVRAAAQTNTLPDIFGVLGGSQDMARFINAKLIHSLTPYLEAENGKWKKSFFNEALDVNRFTKDNQWGIPEGIYGIPIDVANIQMLYNKDIFKEAGITKLPQTWDEFIKTGEKIIKDANKQFFATGFGEVWIINCVLRNFAFNVMGEEKFLKTLKGEVLYSDPDWIECYSKFKEMADKKLFATGIVTMGNKNAERLFATGHVAVTFNGSWSINVYKTMNPDLNYAPMFFPKLTDNYPVVIQRGAGSSFVVSENSPLKNDAIMFLKWLTNEKNQTYLSKNTFNLPANKNSVDKLPSILEDFADDMEKTIHPYLLPVVEDADIIEALGRGIQSIIIGEKTPVEIGEEISKLKQEIIQENQN